jgi:hypothetical protein
MGWFGQRQNSQGPLCPRMQHPRIFGRGHIGQGRIYIAPMLLYPSSPYAVLLLWRSLNVVCESGGYNDPPVPPRQKGLNELCATLQGGLKMEHETLQGGLKMEHETTFCTLFALCRRKTKSIEKGCRASRLCTFTFTIMKKITLTVVYKLSPKHSYTPTSMTPKLQDSLAKFS